MHTRGPTPLGLLPGRLFLFMLGQLVFVAVLSLVLMGVIGKKAGLSALLGGATCILPSVLFALRLFRYTGAQAAKKIAMNFYVGEAVKIFVSVLLFALVFKYVEVSALVFFLTYIAVQMSFWLAPWVLKVRAN